MNKLLIYIYIGDYMSKKLHLITQRDQPFGSRRKCCEKCGRSRYSMSIGSMATTDVKYYTKAVAKEKGLELCT